MQPGATPKTSWRASVLLKRPRALAIVTDPPFAWLRHAGAEGQQLRMPRVAELEGHTEDLRSPVAAAPQHADRRRVALGVLLSRATRTPTQPHERWTSGGAESDNLLSAGNRKVRSSGVWCRFQEEDPGAASPAASARRSPARARPSAPGFLPGRRPRPREGVVQQLTCYRSVARET